MLPTGERLVVATTFGIGGGTVIRAIDIDYSVVRFQFCSIPLRTGMYLTPTRQLCANLSYFFMNLIS